MHGVRGIVEELKVFERNKVPPPFELDPSLYSDGFGEGLPEFCQSSIPSLKPLSGTG